jgi:putative membrane protein
MDLTRKLTVAAGGILLAAGLNAQVTGSSGTSNQATSAEGQTSSGQTTGRSTTPGVGKSQSTTSGAHSGHAGTDTSRSAADKTGNMPALKSFATKAAQGGMAEVELGRLASQKASNDRVKQFGQKMVDDHSKANNDLKQAASQESIELPADTDAKHKQAMQKLSGLSGAAFDKAYMAEMVKDHVHDVQEFEKASKAPGESPVKQFAASTLPTLKEHLQMARDLNNEVKGSASKSGASDKQKPATGASKSY